MTRTTDGAQHSVKATDTTHITSLEDIGTLFGGA